MTDQSVDLYRLISETVTNDPHTVNGGVTYAFDGVGNRQTRASSLAPIPTQTFSGAYDQNDRLTATGYTYDNDGNTLTDPQGNSYVYDSLDRMTQATVNGTTINYVYDGDGNRISKTVGGVTTNYLVDTNNLTGYPQVVDELQGGTVKKVYTYGSSLIAMDDLTGTPTMHFYGKDGQGSTRFLMDSTGTITDTYDYDAFGNLINETHVGTPTSNVYLYDGEQFDSDLDQYYLRARYMNQAIGRFQNMDNFEGDQENSLSLHKYTFVGNDPLNKYDPTGNDPDIGDISFSISAGSIADSEPHLIPYRLNVLGLSDEDKFKGWLFDFKIAASLENVDFLTLVTLGWSESGTDKGWNPNAVNTTGDVGIMQINTGTHPGLAIKFPDVDNIDNGAKILRGDKNKADEYEGYTPPHINTQDKQGHKFTFQLTPPFLTPAELGNDWFVGVWGYKGYTVQGRKNADTWLGIYGRWPNQLKPEFQQLWNTRSSFLQ